MRAPEFAFAGRLAAPLQQAQRLVPGLAVSAVVAIAAAFLAQQYGAPVMLFALLVGMALNFLADEPRCASGIDFAARQVLRLGGTIHDVAQVVGAGYSLSQEAGDTATIVKLLRVALLLPVILLAAALARWHTARTGGGATGGTRPPLLPWPGLALTLRRVFSVQPPQPL